MAVAAYQFGDFRLDCGRFELLRDGRPVRLERKPLELLILLLTSEGQLVTRNEIAARLWSTEVFVDTEHGINTAIRKIRRALDDDPESPRFVQTVTGKGYRFAAPVSAIAPPETPPLPTAQAEPAPPQRRPVVWYIAGAACVLVALAVTAFYRSYRRPPEIAYTQITDFTDSAVAPAISPDGRMLAFIRGSNPFLSSDPIYVKMLPDGEARQLTDDRRPKYGLAFSPDANEIAYTVLDSSTFDTYTVPVLGGEPRLLMKNAAGLVWLDRYRLLFSQVRSGIHLGVVTATETRSGLREIYFPAHERGMAHYAFPSPDRQWALVVEMNGDGNWAPCRLIALEGGSPDKSIGPSGACTSAGWSPDGSWMYFSAAVEGHSHLWRQRFPNGLPEQITFGPAEEDGVAVEPSGRSLITSVGAYQTAIFIHDAAGERPLSSEGEVATGLSSPAFGSDSKTVYYLLRREQKGPGAELWRVEVGSGKSEAMFPGIAMVAFDVSPDGKQVLYAAVDRGGATQVWLAPADKSSPPLKVGGPGATRPHFGAPEKILFQQTEGNSNYLEQMNLDGSNRSKVVPYPILDLQSVSPAHRWAVAAVPRTPNENGPSVVAVPLDGGAPRRLCLSYCFALWSTGGDFLFVELEQSSHTGPGRTLAIPFGNGENAPDLPAAGIPPQSDGSEVKGSKLIQRSNLVPGKDPESFAYVNTTVHGNLYRISLP